MLAVANYMSGTVSLYEINKQTGYLRNLNTIQNIGKGPNSSRQEAAHAHWVGFKGQYLYSVDLGTDEVLKYKLLDTGLGEKETAFKAKSGNGPRHMAFHPKLNRAYLVNELTNSLMVLELNENGNLIELKTINSLPEDFKAHNQAAHIAINEAGTIIYFSNRGLNDITVFAIDNVGDAAIIQRVSTGGNWPRFFKLFERENKLIVANEISGDIVGFNIEKNGTLSKPVNLTKLPKPVFIGEYI